MMVLARIVLPPLALQSFTLSGLLLAAIGTLFLAYDLLGRENGPLRWFTLILTCGLLSALIFVPVATSAQLLLNSVDVALSYILPFILIGVLMGFYTVIIVELPPADTRPPLFSWKGGLLGLALVPLFWFVGVLTGSPYITISALTAGIACALLTSLWQRLTWDPAQAGATPPEIGPVVAGEGSPRPRHHVFSRKGFLLGLLFGLIIWYPIFFWYAVFFFAKSQVIASLLASVSLALISGVICGTWRFISRKRLLLGLLLGFLLGYTVFFAANKDFIASLFESVPLALISGVICGTWGFINWEPLHPKPRLFSRKGFWTGLVAGFVPWLICYIAMLYPSVASNIGAIKGFEIMYIFCLYLSVAGLYSLANAAAGSIAQYTLWKANQLPHHTLGAFGVVLIIVAFALQGVQPAIEILNTIK